MDPAWTRRELLRAALAAGAVLLAPRLGAAEPPAASGARWDRWLVLVELNGGNDGLNTVIPYADPAYARIRRDLAIPRDQVLPLDPRLGLHPALRPLMALWEAKELGVALGLGYERPNRSHFRGIDIWSTGSDSEELLDDGWLARLYAGQRAPDDLVAHGLVLERPECDPLRGGACRSLAFTDPAAFQRAAGALDDAAGSAATPAMAHVLRVQQEVRAAARLLGGRIAGTPDPSASFPRHRFGRQCATAARLIAAGVRVPVIKLALGSFDTHANQLGGHARLLGELAESLAALRQALIAAGCWDRTLVMTFSEFGRRVEPNASKGTDHGTAAPHLCLGGALRGGLVGTQPALDDLAGGDLRFTADYRCWWATAQAWLGLRGAIHAGGHRPFSQLLPG